MPKRAVILIVEDNEDLRDLLKLRLECLDFETVCAANGEDASALLTKDARFNMVITDFHMPSMTGIDLANSAASAGAQMPFVLMSADPRAVDLSVDSPLIVHTLLKPFTASDLIDCLQRHLVVLDQPSTSL